MTKLYLDFETYCELPIKNGVHAYAEEAEILVVAWAFDDEAASYHDCTAGGEFPKKLIEAFNNGAVQIIAHNSHFDRTILRECWGYDVPIERWYDPMVRARLHALPGSLGHLSEILRLAVDKAKDKDGKSLIHLFCKPRPKNVKLRRATRETHPKEWQRFCEYARLDVEAMREVNRQLPDWNYRDGGFDFQLWQLDQAINDRGFAVDIELARSAIQATFHRRMVLADEAQNITNGELRSTTQRDALVSYLLREYKIELPDLRAETLEKALADADLPEMVRALLINRSQASKASVAKYKKILEVASTDGRIRNALNFSGAGRTRRWSGALFQPQNLMRPDMKQPDIEMGIRAVKAGCVDLVYEDPMRVMANAVRSSIVASEGRKLVVADLSNIEGRAAAYLADETWKLDAFRAFDRKEGHDLYALAYAKAFNITAEEVMHNKEHGDGMMRQIGKVMELMLQYEGGVGAFLTGAATYRIDLDRMAFQVLSTIPENYYENARSSWDYAIKKERTFGLAENTFVACDALKLMWRAAHPRISSFWAELRDNALKAIENPGVNFPARRVIFRRDKAWLRCILPSGASLCYPSPRVEGKNGITYMGVHQFTKKWTRLDTYGGKLLENICQSFSRDVMAAAMLRLDQMGYPTVLTVHDEVLTEPKDLPEFNVKELSTVLSTPPDWASGIPLAAAGYEAYRYKKG